MLPYLAFPSSGQTVLNNYSSVVSENVFEVETLPQTKLKVVWVNVIICSRLELSLIKNLKDSKN